MRSRTSSVCSWHVVWHILLSESLKQVTAGQRFPVAGSRAMWPRLQTFVVAAAQAVGVTGRGAAEHPAVHRKAPHNCDRPNPKC